jgi:co-chaperonin GroES (HSP10)
MSQYQVLGERVLVKKELAKQVTGSLLVPDEAKKSGQLCLKGEIIAVGSKVEHVSVGDIVFFSNYAGQFLQLEDSFDDPDLIVMREDEILAIQIGNYAPQPSD